MAAVENDHESTLNQKVLYSSWAQLSVYDRTATSLKQTYLRRRYIVIVVTLIATIASVLTGILSQSLLTSALALVAITFPLTGLYLMADVIKFTGTTDWIKYRYTAEMMRMHVYLYRMQAGIYANCPPGKADNLLVEQLNAIRDEVKPDAGIPPLVSEPEGDEEIDKVIKQANRYSEGDNGLSQIEIEDYVKWRIDGQRHWYNNAIETDFARWKSLFRATQVVLLVGSLMSAVAGFLEIQLVALVAITNAIATALTLWSDVGMTGRFYALFRIASNQLGNQKATWLALQDDEELKDPETRANEIANVAARVEEVLRREREEWYELALQAQSSSDEMILEELKKLTERFEMDQSGAAQKAADQGATGQGVTGQGTMTPTED